MKRAILSRTRYVTAPVLAVALLALAAAPAHAQRREVRNTTHTNLNQNHNTNVNRNTNVNHNTNVNRNTNVNVNRNANVNVNVNNRGGYYGGYYDRGPSVQESSPPRSRRRSWSGPSSTACPRTARRWWSTASRTRTAAARTTSRNIRAAA